MVSGDQKTGLQATNKLECSAGEAQAGRARLSRNASLITYIKGGHGWTRQPLELGLFLSALEQRHRLGPRRRYPGKVTETQRANVNILTTRTRSAGCRLAAGEWCTVDLKHTHTPHTPVSPADGFRGDGRANGIS